jgi:hypothetical protein
MLRQPAHFSGAVLDIQAGTSALNCPNENGGRSKRPASKSMSETERLAGKTDFVEHELAPFQGD